MLRFLVTYFKIARLIFCKLMHLAMQPKITANVNSMARIADPPSMKAMSQLASMPSELDSKGGPANMTIITKPTAAAIINFRHSPFQPSKTIHRPKRRKLMTEAHNSMVTSSIVESLMRLISNCHPTPYTPPAIPSPHRPIRQSLLWHWRSVRSRRCVRRRLRR